MKYILSQEEYDELISTNKKHSETLRDTLQDLCTRVANSELVKEGWYAGKVWGCILTRKDEWYCDDCPVVEECPNRYKEWSK
jgi:hypothetical protein